MMYTIPLTLFGDQNREIRQYPMKNRKNCKYLFDRFFFWVNSFNTYGANIIDNARIACNAPPNPPKAREDIKIMIK